MASKAGRLVSVDYEVFGLVQGVFFRKYTQDKAKALGLVEWVKNTYQGTVVGTVQGPEDKVKLMKDWLANIGSPKSRIEKCVFHNESEVECLKYSDFVIDRPPRKKKGKKSK